MPLAITGPLATDVRRAAETLIAQVPCGRILFIPPTLIEHGLPDLPWFSVYARRLGLIVHAANELAYQAAQRLIARENKNTIWYVQVPNIAPPRVEILSIAPDYEWIAKAITALAGATEGFEMASALADLPLVVVTQMHANAESPPELPLALADALDLDPRHIEPIDETRLGTYRAIEVTTGKTAIYA